MLGYSEQQQEKKKRSDGLEKEVYDQNPKWHTRKYDETLKKKKKRLK